MAEPGSSLRGELELARARESQRALHYALLLAGRKSIRSMRRNYFLAYPNRNLRTLPKVVTLIEGLAVKEEECDVVIESAAGDVGYATAARIAAEKKLEEARNAR